jgi:beta-N-acetylhexosaminidase
MTAHIVNKRLDASGNPGTLSSKIIQGILRGQLNYQGVIFSDDMQMHAIAKHYGLEEAIKLSILAGVDILTFSNNISGSQERTVDKVHSIIRKFVEDGTIPRQRIDESFTRIMRMKQKIGNSQIENYRKEMIRLEQESSRMRALAGQEAQRANENLKIAQENYEKSLKEQSKEDKKKKKN